MKTTLFPIFYIFGGVFLLLILMFFLFFGFTKQSGLSKTVYIHDKDAKIENVVYQPKEALKMAEPYIDEHATYVFKEDKQLKTHIVKHRKWYYIRQTNYPAKTIKYYMNSAIKVNSKTGELVLPKK